MLFVNILGKEKTMKLIEELNKSNIYMCTQSEARAKLDYVYKTRDYICCLDDETNAIVKDMVIKSGYTGIDIIRYSLFCMMIGATRNKFTIDPNINIKTGTHHYNIRLNERVNVMIRQITGPLKSGILGKNLAMYIKKYHNHIYSTLKSRVIDIVDTTTLKTNQLNISNSLIEELGTKRVTSLNSILIEFEAFAKCLSTLKTNKSFNPDREFEYLESNHNGTLVSYSQSVKNELEPSTMSDEDDVTMKDMVEKLFNRPNCYLSEAEGEAIVNIIEKVGKNNISLKELKSILDKAM